jgi:tripartite-type tricarboxylate transporter receptor subunit TctC
VPAVLFNVHAIQWSYRGGHAGQEYILEALAGVDGLPMNRCLAVLLLTLGASLAAGAEFPERDIQLVVPFEPGGAGDITSRIIAESVNGLLDDAEIRVINRSGGGGIVGQTFVSRARPDGYTLLSMTSSVVTNPRLKGASYSVDDFRPVALYNFDPEVIAVSADSPFADIGALVGEARKRKLNMVTAGIATTHHMVGLAIEEKSDLGFNYLPIRGFGKQLQAVMGNHADGGFWPLGEAATHADGGTIRILAVAAAERDERFPDVPTFAEAGLPITVWATFRGWAVPRETPDDVVATLAELLRRVDALPEYRRKMEAAGYRPVYRSAEEFQAVVDEYRLLTDAVIEAHGLAR